MRLQLPRLCVLIVGLATMLAMAGVGTAYAAPTALSSAATPAQPRLTTNTNAPCNAESRKGYARCFAVVRTPANHEIQPNASQPPPTALGPADIQDAYNLPTGQGGGQTVAIVDAGDDPTAESDLAVFRSQYGLPPCTSDNGCFKKVNQAGEQGNYPVDRGWGIEISLDLDAVSAACPKCNILLVEANNAGVNNLGPAVDTAVSLGAKYVSNSYGAGEFAAEASDDHYFDHPGVAVTVASGDIGNTTYWPSTNPNVIAVGGTRLTRDESTERGWTETVWGVESGGQGGGSGCSAYEPKPDYQSSNGLDTDCDMRATADISADAHPASGLAVYDSNDGYGWTQVGGTSLASPLIAAMYALAGSPAPDTYPVTSLYDPAVHDHMFDVTEGSNGSCGNLLCQAGPGWDGPTGWGTPNGVQALTTGPHGDITGAVTEANTGDPIVGATVSAGDYRTRTDEDGEYDLHLAVDSYDVTARKFGYADKTQTGVQVMDGETVTVDFALARQPTNRTLSGTVTDASGHGWPLYSKITVAGDPNGPFYSNPYTGHYSISLPQGSSYSLDISPRYPGYETSHLQVAVGTADVQQNVKVAVVGHAPSCTAPGYIYDGISAGFTGWTGNTPQGGWTVTDGLGNGNTWDFDDDYIGQLPPNSDGDFASAHGRDLPASGMDTALVSPVVDLSQADAPVIIFDSDYIGFTGSGEPAVVGDVDLSLDDGQTWTNVLHQGRVYNFKHFDIPIPQAAGQATVRVRFHFTEASDAEAYGWDLDNVFIGAGTCAPVAGGLLAGVVTDANTGDPVNGAKVASDNNADETAVSMATPDDSNLPDGFYWLFHPGTGNTDFTTTYGTAYGNYTPATVAMDVAGDQVTHQDIALRAGHLVTTPNGISVTEHMGTSTTEHTTLTNDGTAPMHVSLGEDNGRFTPMDGQAWMPIADYPTRIVGNAVGYYDGRVYSVGGSNDFTQHGVAYGYVYDPSTQRWTAIADEPQTLMGQAGAFVGGKMYLAGGLNSYISTQPRQSTYAYDPSSNSWSRVADAPVAVYWANAAVLDGRLYVIGGCTISVYVTPDCNQASSVVRYDPSSDSWDRLADYPVPVADGACAGIGGEIVCAGGTSGSRVLSSTYIYHPGSDTWTQGADMPYPNWGMAHSGANDKLQVATGATTSSAAVTSRAAEYDPVSNAWTSLPDVRNAELHGGSSCGMYQIGGEETAGVGHVARRVPSGQVLPGYYQCDDDVSWLSEDSTVFDLAVGQSVTVKVRVDSSAVSQPGDYAAGLSIHTDTPYHFHPVTVAMHVDPPVTWGKIAGTVTAAGSGDPIAGATVQVCSNYNPHRGGCGPVSFTLKTDHTGHYQTWLDIRYNPLQVIAAKDGYVLQVRTARVRRGTTKTVDFTLQRLLPSSAGGRTKTLPRK